MSQTSTEREEVTIRFAGDSGDGMQLTGSLFTNTTALEGNDLRTLPEFPAEIRAPAGTVPGVSSFQLHFGSKEILTPGDKCDVLVVMNVAALIANLSLLNKGGTIIANTSGFDSRNLNLANYEGDVSPLEDDTLSQYNVLEIDVTKLTKESLSESDLGYKDKERCKNMFVLGLLYWMYSRPLDSTISFLEKKFKDKPDIAEANVKVLKEGYHYGETTEVFSSRYSVKEASLEPGTYRNITGTDATVLGLVSAAHQSKLPLFFGSYPITPASDILHGLSKQKHFGVYTFQAEDEIAAVSSAIGAAFGGSLGVTSSSGPGIALKGEAIGLAVMLELPLVVLNIQRAGPSTGMPTKTEQADLMQAMYGRNGESPAAIVAPRSPADCYNMVFEACRIALEHMIPVMFLSDGYLANGSEPWKFPQTQDLKEIEIKFEPARTNGDGEKFLPYVRDDRFVRSWSIPGTKGLEHRVGGLEKEDLTGDVSYDPDNHEKMVMQREAKRDKIADFIPPQEVDNGVENGETVVLGWGSTYGSIRTAVHELRTEGMDVSHIHLQYISPFPRNLEELLKGYDNVLVPEINNGQLVRLIRDKFQMKAIGINKIKGRPFGVEELKQEIKAAIPSKSNA
ncbi:2-oxoacid:acceptor oxidoreductase subunit alpha [Aliifodinibius sp. S!AR15-10]|uniref:2-oxoacid:acceptor oxidoreductase subunit alpha n=1 Tax=Aliifodinibius sp. S!AR15-10 TaxID=2950437 RepID=UPI002855F219|nr:2-oxoacid:acceptor oxidoreductase subunit alpha [Aliifodinibius sp. S!AR15-10]MDR8392320.1 2-oxoacid:acceptor oxidoreductase subunit alpha [Aliifodinibius sp. S!AR15-10]